MHTLSERVKSHRSSSARSNTETVNKLPSKGILFLGLKHSCQLAAIVAHIHRTDLSVFSLSVNTFSPQVNYHPMPARLTGLLAVIKHTWYIPVLCSLHLLLSYPGNLCYKYSRSVLPYFTNLFVQLVSSAFIQMPALPIISQWLDLESMNVNI